MTRCLYCDKHVLWLYSFDTRTGHRSAQKTSIDPDPVDHGPYIIELGGECFRRADPNDLKRGALLYVLHDTVCLRTKHPLVTHGLKEGNDVD